MGEVPLYRGHMGGGGRGGSPRVTVCVLSKALVLNLSGCRAIAVKVAAKRLPVSPFSGFDLYHHFRNEAFYDLYNLFKVRKTGKREVVLLQPLPQWLYSRGLREICLVAS